VEELSKGTDRLAPWQRPDAKHLDATTVASWVDATATTPVGDWWTRVMCRTWGGLGSFEASDASMLHLAWSQSNSPQEELPDAFLFDGGAAQVVELLAKQLSPGTVKLRSPVAVLRHSTHSVSAVTYRGEHYSADAVVIAMPPHLTGRIRYEPPLPAGRDALVQRVPMGALIKVLVTYKTPFWRDTGLSGIAMGNLQVLETVADSTNPRPGWVLRAATRTVSALVLGYLFPALFALVKAACGQLTGQRGGEQTVVL
jgi:monoamine oxidase